MPPGPETSGPLRETSRASTTSLRIQDIDSQLGHVADRMAALEAQIQRESAAAAARATASEQSGQATARTVRIVVVVLVIMAIVVALQLGVRIANV